MSDDDTNYWSMLMGDDEGASTYMETYGEGVGSETRHTIGSFINDGESVLDVGCGPGWNFDHFREYGPRIGTYKGLDYSERFVRVANERYLQNFPISQQKKNKYTEYPNLPFHKGDVRHIIQPDSSWDVVLLQDVLEHTNGYERPVTEALRVAKKRIIIVFWRMTESDTDTINDDGNDGYGAAYSRSKWETFLDSLGYMWVRTESEPEANRKHDFYIIDKEEPR